MEECGAGLPARNGLAQPLVKAGVLLICNGFSRSQKMHKSVYNATVRVARLLHRPSYKFITRNTTVWKKSVSEHPLSPASPRKADVPAPAPLREGSQPQPLSIHPGAAALKPRSTWTCPGYSLASKGSRSYKSHFSSSLCATSLLVIPDFYMPSQGAAAFAAIPREARHTRDRNRCCCRAARDDVAQWLAQISKPAQGQPLAEPTGHDGQHSHRLCSTKHTEKEEAWSSRSNRTRDCKCIQSYTPGKVGYVCSQLWFSVTHSTHRFSAKVRFDSQSQLRNNTTTDKASPILAALPNINHLCHLWSCHLLIKIPPQLHAIWRCPLGSTAQHKAICYVMLPDSELPALVLTGNEALEMHGSAFAKYRPWTLIFCLWMTTHNDNSMLGITSSDFFFNLK